MPSYVNGYVDGSSVVLLSRDAGGRLVETRESAEWALFLKAAEVPEDVKRNLRSASQVSSFHVEGPWLRVGFRDARSREALCYHPQSPLLQLGIPTYEGDVDPLRRLLTDRTDVSIAPPRRCYLDIETDSRVPPSKAKEGAARVLSWSIIGAEPRRVRWGVLEADSDAAEAKLLWDLWEVLGEYDQVLAWSGDDFDFPVITKRSQHLRVAFDPRRWLGVDHLELFRRMNQHASQSGSEKQSMKLQNIATATLGLGKLDEEGIVPGKALGAQTYEMWNAGGEWRERLVRYMVRDTDLLRQIEKKTGYAALFGTLCEVCLLFGDSRAINPTRQMDGFMLRLGKTRNHHFTTRKFFEELEGADDQFKGAYVMDPQTSGIERDVHVVDFASLYPSIILTWNMSPDTKAAIPVNGPIPPGHCRSPSTGLGFRTDTPGILPEALRELLRLRKEWSTKQAQIPPGTPDWEDAGRRSMAYKVAANSFYGVLGSPFSRYHDRSVAESVTQNGVWLLKHTAAAAEARVTNDTKWRVVYADTDSCFVTGPTDDEFNAFTKWCNDELYPKIIKDVGCVENTIKLAYEKKFRRIVFVSAKRYCGSYAHYKGKASTNASKPEIKGLEYKRGDASLLARQLQGQIIDLLVGGLKLHENFDVPTDNIEVYHEVVSRMRSHVLNDPLPIHEVVLAQALSRELSEYVAKRKVDGSEGTLPAHVRVAKILRERGELMSEGTRVEYVVVDGTTSPMTVMPAADYTGGEVDRHHVWEDKVWPPTERLLMSAFPEHDWPSWGRTRPPKVRKRKEDDKQLELGEPPKPKPEATASPPVAPSQAPKPMLFEVHVDEALVKNGLAEVHALIKKHPGRRPVEVHMHMASGAVVVLKTILKTSGAPALVEELIRYHRPSAA